ncbi:MAG: ATP-binding protein [Actinomycetota bacterium]
MESRKNFSRLFEELVIELKSNLFLRARLRLALFYIGVIAALLLVFSLTLYYTSAQNIKENADGEFLSEQAQEAFIDRTVNRLQSELLLIDGAIIFLVGGLGFWLAGKTLQPIKESLDIQKRFIADASHELRTPLAIMKTSLEVALKDARGESSGLLSSNLEEVERMNRIVEDLLVLSRIDNKQEHLTFSATNVSELILKCIRKMSTYAGRRSISITQEIEPGLFILADADKLQQAILNVVKNAIDYSNDGETIAVNLKRAGTHAIITVTDNGLGISPDDLPHVFDRFYRADKSRSRKHCGSGLGLSIAQWIIHEHRGDIVLQSSPGKGTTTTILLPLFPKRHR